MWKVLNKCSPNDLDIQFGMPSRLGIQAKLPKLRKQSTMHHQRVYDNSFAVLGPKLWNSIPVGLTTLTSFDEFKNKLTNFLKSLPDNPPTTGYIGSNNNSILDWRYSNKITDKNDKKW